MCSPGTVWAETPRRLTRRPAPPAVYSGPHPILAYLHIHCIRGTDDASCGNGKTVYTGPLLPSLTDAPRQNPMTSSSLVPPLSLSSSSIPSLYIRILAHLHRTSTQRHGAPSPYSPSCFRASYPVSGLATAAFPPSTRVAYKYITSALPPGSCPSLLAITNHPGFCSHTPSL